MEKDFSLLSFTNNYEQLTNHFLSPLCDTTINPQSVGSATMATTNSNDDTAVPLLPPTEMVYYTHEGNFQLSCEAVILSCELLVDENDKDEEAKEDEPSTQVKVILNRTVLHAQGGGQPSDCGILRLLVGEDDEDEPRREIAITKVLLDRTTGVATHFGTIGNNDLELWVEGQRVQVLVDAHSRELHSECHTAGHVVHMAMHSADSQLQALPPVKAYHFLEGPYVEYKGKLAPEDKGPLLEKLQESFAKLLEGDAETEIQNVSRSEAEEICQDDDNRYKIKDTFQEDETVRIVKVAGMSVPCGGTHIKSTGLLKQRNWGIVGFRCKKGVVRVKYGQDWNK